MERADTADTIVTLLIIVDHPVAVKRFSDKNMETTRFSDAPPRFDPAAAAARRSPGIGNADACKNHPASGGLQRAGDLQIDQLTDIPLSSIDNDHGAVL